MTCRAWSARLISSMAAVSGARRSATASETSRRAARTWRTRSRCAFGHARLLRAVVTQPIRAFQMDDPLLDEELEGVIELGQLLVRETIVVVEGVQEVEGHLDTDVVRVTRRRGGMDIR